MEANFMGWTLSDPGKQRSDVLCPHGVVVDTIVKDISIYSLVTLDDLRAWVRVHARDTRIEVCQRKCY